MKFADNKLAPLAYFATLIRLKEEKLPITLAAIGDIVEL